MFRKWLGIAGIAEGLLGDCLGIALEASRSALEPSWSVFGTVLERLGPSWKRLGGSLEASLERLGGVLEAQKTT